jgi:PAS domain S-box-containing protein
MDGAQQSLINLLTRVIRKPGFWFILALVVLITLYHYEETLGYPAFLTQLMSNLGLTRHAFDRILYLAPIVWAGFIFGWRGTFIISMVALACMLPRAVFISPSPSDAIFETSAVFIIGNALAISFGAFRKEREYRTQLEVTQQELRTSEDRYRKLFENAHDAIWLHDLQGNIIAANKSLVRLTRYTQEELQGIKADDLITGGCIENIKGVEYQFLKGEAMGHLSEMTLVRKDKSEVSVQLSTNPVFSNRQIVAYQHIARDITEQKRMQENLRSYLHQVTRAQEEERKRISHELHDETIQALVVLSRQLDILASSDKGLPEDDRLRLEELIQQSNKIMQGVRRLSQDLRPAALDRLGLLSALEWLAADVTEYSGISTKVNVLGNEHRLSEEVELVLFRITQEALRNVWRHSQATEAEIIVEFDESKIRVSISDNGRGFSLPKTITDLARDGKLGLAGMQERAQLIGGTLTVKSEPGRGSIISVELPIWLV